MGAAFLLATPACATLARRRDTISQPGRAPLREIAPSFVPVSCDEPGAQSLSAPGLTIRSVFECIGRDESVPTMGCPWPEHARVRWSGRIDPELPIVDPRSKE